MHHNKKITDKQHNPTFLLATTRRLFITKMINFFIVQRYIFLWYVKIHITYVQYIQLFRILKATIPSNEKTITYRMKIYNTRWINNFFNKNAVKFEQIITQNHTYLKQSFFIVWHKIYWTGRSFFYIKS